MSCHLSTPAGPQETPASPWAVRAERFPAGFAGRWCRADRARLLYPSRGVMTLHTRRGSCVVPPLRGYWLPAGEEYRMEAPGGLEMHTVYCQGLASLCPVQGGVVPVSPLMREIILALEGQSAAGDDFSPLPRIGVLLTGQLAAQERPPLALPRIAAGPLRCIADALATDPADARGLQDWARELATSTRTLARAFRRETGMSFREFRLQVRLRAAMERLAGGERVTAVAHALGFGTASNFSTMFRRATGVTPRAYFEGRRSG